MEQPGTRLTQKHPCQPGMAAEPSPMSSPAICRPPWLPVRSWRNKQPRSKRGPTPTPRAAHQPVLASAHSSVFKGLRPGPARADIYVSVRQWRKCNSETDKQRPPTWTPLMSKTQSNPRSRQQRHGAHTPPRTPLYTPRSQLSPSH